MTVETERYIGLCMAAGGIRSGTDTVLSEARAGHSKLVLVACDASDRTKKQISDKCSYYKVKLFSTELTADEIASMIGKHSACVAVSFTGRGPWANVLKALESEKTDVPDTTEDRKDDN